MGTGGQALAILRSTPNALVLPAVSALSVLLILLMAAFLGFRSPKEALEAGPLFFWIQGLIWRPQVLAAYFLAGFVFFAVNAVLIHCLLQHDAGRRVDLGRAFLAVSKRTVPIAVLSLAVFGGLLFLQAFRAWLRRSEGGLPAWMGSLVDLGFLGIEAGVFMATNLTMAVMLGRGMGLREASRETLRIVPLQAGAALRSIAGIATMRHEAPAALVVCAWGACVLAVPYFTEAQNPLLLFPIGLLFGAILASCYLAFVQAIEAVFAAGIYLHSRGKEAPVGFRSEDMRILDKILRTPALAT